MAEQRIEDGLISVIMSTYNRSSDYLRESMESILNQTYRNFEFIIIDDGSDNGTKELIESYRDPRIRLVINEKNIGLTRSLNKALDLCRGEFIARMDDDDIALPERFEKQFAYMRQHPDVIVCGTWVDVIDGSGRLTGKVKHYLIEDMEAYRIYLLFGNHPNITHPSAMINRRLFLENHLRYEPDYNLAEDYRLWLRCAAIGKCAILQEVLLKYRRHSGSISVAKEQRQANVDYVIIQEQLDALHLTLPDELKELHHYLLSRQYYLQENNNRSLRKWLDQIIKANRKYRVYDPEKLERILRNRWKELRRYAFHWQISRIHRGLRRLLKSR